MSNKTSINVLGVEFTRFIAVCEGREFYFAEKKSDVAIKTALGHFPSGKVALGIVETADSLYDISDLRDLVVEVEADEAGEVEVEPVAKKRGGRNPPRNSNHSPRQAAYFGL